MDIFKLLLSVLIVSIPIVLVLTLIKNAVVFLINRDTKYKMITRDKSKCRDIEL